MKDAVPCLIRAEIATPIGRMILVGRYERLCLAAFRDGWTEQRLRLDRRFGRYELKPGTLAAATLLSRYFAGDLDALGAIEVDPGGTPFQRRVWKRLSRIRAGSTATYGELARSLGAPRASRAVGAANGANPVAVAIPCHRLVGSTGALTGYAFGVRRKRWLLRHEGVSVRAVDS